LVIVRIAQDGLTDEEAKLVCTTVNGGESVAQDGSRMSATSGAHMERDSDLIVDVDPVKLKR